jgi:hypothetical protein
MHERPSRRSVLAALVSAVGAGCLGSDPSATPSPTASPTPNTDCPPALVVSEADPAGIDTDAAVDYGSLSAEKRATFDRARNGSVEEFAYDWRDVDVVAHDGEYYRVSVVVC